MKIAFITVLYKTPEVEVQRLKKEIDNLGFSDYQKYFIDNTANNRGYAAGVNQGIRQALASTAQIFIILNPDISFNKISKDTILEVASKYDLSGFAFEEHDKKYYGGVIDRLRASGGLISLNPQKKYTETDFVSGSLMIIKKKVIDKIGLIDESYFMYYEDVDYCFRAKKAGFKVGTDNSVFYKRLENTETNPEKKYYLKRGHLIFLFKHGLLKQKIYELIRLPKTVLEEREALKIYLKKKPFFFNFFSLNFASLTDKAIHFFLFLFLINTLSVKQYGIYTLIWVHTGLLSPLLDFGTTSYGLVYMDRESKKKFISLYSLRVSLSIVVFTATIILAFIFKYDTVLLFYTALVSFVIFSNMFSGTFLILSSLLQKIYIASYVSIIFNLLSSIVIVLILFFFKKFNFLFITIFVSYIFYSVTNYLLIKSKIKALQFTIDLHTWLAILKKSFVFLLISSLAGLYFKLDVFLLNFLKGQNEVGLYSSGYKFLDALLLMAASYNISAIPVFSSLIKQGVGPFLKKIKKDLVLLLLIGGSITLLIYFLSPVIFPHILRDDYLKAISVLRVVVWAFPFILITSVFLNSLYVMGKAHIVVFIFLFQIVFNFSLNYLFIPHYSYMASSYITVIGEIINTLLTFAIFRLYLRKLKKYENINRRRRTLWRKK